MNWFNTIIAILSCLGMGGIIAGVISRKLDKRDKKQDEIEKERKKTDVLIIKSIFVIGSLARANTIAMKNGKMNGESEAALKEYEDCKKELDNHLIDMSANK